MNGEEATKKPTRDLIKVICLMVRFDLLRRVERFLRPPFDTCKWYFSLFYLGLSSRHSVLDDLVSGLSATRWHGNYYFFPQFYLFPFNLSLIRCRCLSWSPRVLGKRSCVHHSAVIGLHSSLENLHQKSLRIFCYFRVYTNLHVDLALKVKA